MLYAFSFLDMLICNALLVIANTLHLLILANCIAMWPMQPIPKIPNVELGFGFVVFTALYAVTPAQNKGAANSDLILFGTNVVKFSLIVIYSEYSHQRFSSYVCRFA